MERIWEVDVARGVAIIAMILFHFAFNLQYFFGVNVGMPSLFWEISRILIASTFLLLVGISLVLYSQNKIETSWKIYFLRGLKIFCWGMLLTGITYILFGQSAIVFGILHLIGIAIILSYLLLLRSRLAVILAGVSFILGFFIRPISANTLWFVWAGIEHPEWVAVDYYPLFPWVGVVFLGIAIGNKLYERGKRTYSLTNCSNTQTLAFLGRHSLLIYLIHQPLLIVLLAGFFWVA